MPPKMLLRLVVILCLTDGVVSEYKNIAGLPSTSYKLLGDINIGGIFPLHQAGYNASYCGALRELGVFQRAEAMAYYIQQINKDPKMLGGIKLGFNILDDCYKETTALARGLQFIPHVAEHEGNRTSPLGRSKEDVVAVIGAESSTNSKQLAELLGLFAIPQVSYLSTSPLLGDAILYPYFSRIVPSDKYQIVAMVDLMKYFQWTYISFIYSLSFYGLHAYLILAQTLRERENLCLAVEFGLPENPTAEDYDEVVDMLVKERERRSSHHVVILFLSQTSAIGVLRAAKERRLHGKFTWVASDAWGRNRQDFRGVEDIAEGTLTVKLASKNDPNFDRHFSNLSPRNYTNPFFLEFWNKTCNDSKKNCDGNTTFGNLDDIYKPESTVGLVKVAVYFLANSLQELHNRCKYKDRGQPRPCSGRDFREYIKGEDLQQLLYRAQGTVDGMRVNVAMGEGKTQYSIMNFRHSGRNDYELEKIGYFETQNSTLHMFPEDGMLVKWHPAINPSDFDGKMPQSVCSTPCNLGQQQTRSNFLNSKCCWECDDCKRNEFTEIVDIDGLQTYQCTACGLHNHSAMKIFASPNSQQDGCEPIVPKNIDASDSFSIAIIVVDVVGIAITLALLAIYFKNRKHRLIKATSLELSYVIWFGVFFSYMSIIFYFLPLQSGCDSPAGCEAEPNSHWCYFQFVTFSMSFTIINAPLLTRANRIYRIFAKGKKSAVKPKFIESHYQLIFTGALILVQVAIVTICCIVSIIDKDEGSTIQITNTLDNDDLVKSYIACDIPLSLLLPPVVYNLLLCVACAYHAFKTRRLPDNFKESRYIGMAVYTTVIVWIAVLPTYVSINDKYYKGVPLCIAMVINALITTSCLFVPRLYALRWIEGARMNLRSLSVSLQSVGDKSRQSSCRTDSSADRHRSLSNDSSKHIMSTPDIISTNWSRNSPEDDNYTLATDLSTISSNTVTFKELDNDKEMEDTAIASADC